MKTPKVNEVWETQQNRLVLIVDAPEPSELCMLWFDEIECEFTVSKLYSRLKCRRDNITVAELFTHWAEMLS